MIVVDSNIFFSSLLSKSSRIVELLLSQEYHFTSPNFVFTELFKYKEKIIRYSKLLETELLELMNNLFSRIQFIPTDFISSASFKKAIQLCADIDPKDAVFVALTIELNALFWNGDKTLRNGLIAKGFNQFFIL